jgi:hypothetical protein
MWAFWMFEENVKLINEILEEEESNRKKQEEEEGKQQQYNGFDPSTAMKSTQNMMNNVPKF